MTKKTTVGAVAKDYSTDASLTGEHREKSLSRANNSSVQPIAQPSIGKGSGAVGAE